MDEELDEDQTLAADDLSRAGRIVLVIDHYVPKPDRDAGSKTMFQFLACLVGSGWSVSFWPENLHNDEAYTPKLRDMGVEVFTGWEHHPFEGWIAQHGHRFDAILTSRPHITMPVLAAIRAHSRGGLAYYGHDVHHLRMLANASVDNAAVSSKEIEIVQTQEEEIWRQSDVVLYPSHTETEYVRQRMPLTDARTISPYFYDSFEYNAYANLASRKGVIFVAGFGHPPNVDAALWLVNEIMPRVWTVTPNIKLSLVGSDPTEAVFGLASEQVEVTGWVDEDTLQRSYREARVAVVPLRYGAGVKSKVVEAMRAGLPLVTTDTGVQGLPDAAMCVEVHSSPEAFANAILELTSDDDLWRARSTHSASFVSQRFTREIMRHQINDALITAAAKGRRKAV